ncbi:MAG: hypothetical protein ACLFSB_14560 [Chitinispirillaceae bacterium]
MNKANQINGIRFLPLSSHATVFWFSDWASLFDWNNNTIDFYVDVSSHLYESFVLRNLKLLLMFHANRTGRLMMHASGVRKKDIVLVFSGRSGIGKSTTAKRFCARGWQLLNDECIIVERNQKNMVAASTPFCRLELMETCNQNEGKLSALFFLKHARRHAIKEMTKRERIVSLASNSFLLPLNDNTCSRHMDICSDLATENCIYELQTANENSVVDYVTSCFS